MKNRGNLDSDDFSGNGEDPVDNNIESRVRKLELRIKAIEHQNFEYGLMGISSFYVYKNLAEIYKAKVEISCLLNILSNSSYYRTSYKSASARIRTPVSALEGQNFGLNLK